MTRTIRLFLSFSVVCGVISLLIFYLYTSRYSSRIHLSLRTNNTPRIKKTDLTEGKTKIMSEEYLLSSVQPVTINTLPVATRKSPGNSGEDSDTTDEKTTQTTKRSHNEIGDESVPTNLGEQQEKSTPSSSPTTTTTTTTTTKPIQKTTAVIDSSQNENLGFCDEKPPSLTGPLFVNQNVPKMDDVEKHFSEEFGGWVKKGGAWKPAHCEARVKMALIIPFRKRYEQLGIFVRHMHPMLKRQEVDYRIIVVEQSGSTPFNRAILFNIGYKEALKFKDFDCFIFHDVDLIPEDDHNMYTCPTSPRHMSVAVDKFNYRLPYSSIFGGAGAFSRKHFEEINGFSNMFWGWGGEDDDLYHRIVAKGHHLTRPSLQIGRYKMIRVHHHQSSQADPNRHNLLQNSMIRMAQDGLNSLKYQLLKVEERLLYTLVTVHVDSSML